MISTQKLVRQRRVQDASIEAALDELLTLMKGLAKDASLRPVPVSGSEVSICGTKLFDERMPEEPRWRALPAYAWGDPASDVDAGPDAVIHNGNSVNMPVAEVGEGEHLRSYLAKYAGTDFSPMSLPGGKVCANGGYRYLANGTRIYIKPFQPQTLEAGTVVGLQTEYDEGNPGVPVITWVNGRTLNLSRRVADGKVVEITPIFAVRGRGEQVVPLRQGAQFETEGYSGELLRGERVYVDSEDGFTKQKTYIETWVKGLLMNTEEDEPIFVDWAEGYTGELMRYGKVLINPEDSKVYQETWTETWVNGHLMAMVEEDPTLIDTPEICT